MIIKIIGTVYINFKNSYIPDDISAIDCISEYFQKVFNNHTITELYIEQSEYDNYFTFKIEINYTKQSYNKDMLINGFSYINEKDNIAYDIDFSYGNYNITGRLYIQPVDE